RFSRDWSSDVCSSDLLAANRIMQNDGDFVASALEEIVDSLSPDADEDEQEEAAEAPPRRPLVIGLPVRDKLDEIALALLAALLREQPCDYEILPAEAFIGEKIAEIDARRPAAVCVLSLPPGDLTATRHAAKRLRARVPGVAVIVGRLGSGAATARSRQLLRTAGVRDVAFSLEKLAELLAQIVREAARRPADETGAEPELSAAR